MKKFKINHKSKSSNEVDILFSGYLILENLEAIRIDLQKIIKDKKILTIHFEDIAEIDLAFVQILLVLENDKNLKNVSINYEQIEKKSSFNHYLENLKVEKNGNK